MRLAISSPCVSSAKCPVYPGDVSPDSSDRGCRARRLRREDETPLPHDQGGRLMISEKILKFRIERNICAVVVEEVHLDITIPGQSRPI